MKKLSKTQIGRLEYLKNHYVFSNTALDSMKVGIIYNYATNKSNDTHLDVKRLDLIGIDESKENKGKLIFAIPNSTNRTNWWENIYLLVKHDKLIFCQIVEARLTSMTLTEQEESNMTTTIRDILKVYFTQCALIDVSSIHKYTYRAYKNEFREVKYITEIIAGIVHVNPKIKAIEINQYLINTGFKLINLKSFL